LHAYIPLQKPHKHNGGRNALLHRHRAAIVRGCIYVVPTRQDGRWCCRVSSCSTARPSTLIMFHPNCTLPPQDVHIVAPTNLRGTLDILWASLATALACTYSLLYYQPRGSEHRVEESIWAEIIIYIGRFIMTALACLVPEMVLMDAVQDWIMAKRRLAELHRTLPATKSTWGMRHMMFAGQSSFAVSYDEPTPSNAGEDPSDEEGDVELQPRSTKETKPVTRHILRLAPQALFTALQEGIISPHLATTSEIKSRCPSNAWAKILTVFQITYFVLEITVRAIRRLPISQLELGVAGIVACSSVSYCFTFHKPGGSQSPYPLVLHDYGLEGVSPRMKELRQSWDRDQSRNTIHLPSLRRRCTDPLKLTNPDQPTTTRVNSPFHGDPALAIAVFAMTSLVLGAVHLAGWNYAFPSPIDATLWRSMAITTTAIPPFWLVVFAIIPKPEEHERFKTWFDRCTKTIFAVYCLARVILIVEMGRCFFYLPPEAFLTSWVVNIPHIG
jgi:hypothetical protein